MMTAIPIEMLSSILMSRHSCRGFQDERVPTHDIERMLEMAQRTPSWCNTQPWKISIVSGDARTRLSEALLDMALTGTKEPDLEAPSEYVGIYKERRQDSGYALYESLGIDRKDHQRRVDQSLENFRFFGAQHVAIISTDRQLGPYGAVDCGAYLSTFLLAAEALGIATVPQAAIAMYSATVRQQLEMDDDRVVVCAISFGYEDRAKAVNSFRTSRAELGDVVEWIED
jgi:nitroreductase